MILLELVVEVIILKEKSDVNQPIALLFKFTECYGEKMRKFDIK